MVKLVLEKTEEPEIKFPTSVCSSKKLENSRKTSTSPSLTELNHFYCVDHNKLWKILKEMGIPNYLTCFLRNLYASQEAIVEPDMEQWTGSKLGKEYIIAIYCHLACLTYMQSTSCEVLDWMKDKLESR